MKKNRLPFTLEHVVKKRNIFSKDYYDEIVNFNSL